MRFINNDKKIAGIYIRVSTEDQACEIVIELVNMEYWDKNEKLKKENKDLKRLNYQYENQYKSLKEKTNYLIYHLNKVLKNYLNLFKILLKDYLIIVAWI